MEDSQITSGNSAEETAESAGASSGADSTSTVVFSALLILTLAALFLSGIAGVANQVAWQRGLKVFLGGSETLSSMVVVLVFMLGLGLGAGWMGSRAGRIKHPLRAFALVELALFAVNLGIAFMLSMDLAPTVFAVERFVVLLGVPLRLIYVIGALIVLLPPTLLMGATLPIASEACQRQFGASEKSLITILFLLNTLGAVVGAFGTSFYLLPWLGQQTSLLSAATMNLGAGALLWFGAQRAPAASEAPEAPRTERTRRPLSLEEILGFWLGGFSLGYEMYLLRTMSLAHEPLPTTFATTLCFFLLFWSGGVYLASRVRERVGLTLALGALLTALMPFVYGYDRFTAHFSLYQGGLLYFLPCICFGLLYGALVSRSATSWGQDVGRFYFLNTMGSCLGILFFTLVGYEFQHDLNAYLIALGLLGLLSILIAREWAITDARRWAIRAGQAGILLSIGVVGVHGWTNPSSSGPGGYTYWGRDGVVEVRKGGNVFIDGLWHSRLSNGRNHIGDPYTWLMAVSASLAHRDTPIENALIVGNGVGITAGTLVKTPGLSIVAYEINHTLSDLLENHRAGSLGSVDHPRIELRWQDARSGLALDETKYDLIISAPLYLRQAGSSLLLSREYMELAKSRLKDDGVMAIYSKEGNERQSLLVHRTVRSVFPHVQVVIDGQITLASRIPIEITPQSIRNRIARQDPLQKEIELFDNALRRRNKITFYEFLNPRRIESEPGVRTISDDHPLVEYPSVVNELVSPARALRRP